MIRMFPLLVAATAVSTTASAQSCPPGASTAVSIPSGSSVKVIGLHPEDAYYDSSYATTVGQSGTATDSLTNQGGCWFSGPVNGADGSSFYFYKAALSVDSGVGVGQAPMVSCPAGAISSAPSVGRMYTVLGLHPDDAYSGGGTVGTGLEVTFQEGTTVRDGCWISGPATSSAGELYFFKVAVAEATGSGSRVLNGCPSNAHRGAIPAGSQITFLGIDPEDAYANGTGSFQPGQVMTADANMNNNGGCWYGGSVSWPGGSAYFYKAAFSVGTGGTVSSSADAATRIRALAGGDSLDREAEAIMLDVYDSNRNGSIDNLNELNGIPCDTMLALDEQYQRKWGVSVRAVLGFKSNLSWVGGAIGFDRSLREAGDRQMSRCGIQ